MHNGEHNHVLLVDDSEGTRFAIGRMLEVAGFNVTEAANGTDGLRLAREMPDLIVLDVRLPDMSGFDVCREIKSNPATAAIPILHVSASFVRAEDQVYGLEGGADGYLTEPVDRAVLIATARALIRARRAEATAREAMIAAESANRAKDRFLATLSHELRTPLTPALMTVSVLARDSDIAPSVREDLTMVQRNLELEVALIDDLLDLSRAASGKLRLHLQPVSLHEVLRHVMRICTSDIQVKRLDVREQFAADVDTVGADASRLRQVFWNVLKNAVKFTPPNGRIRVTTESADGSIHVCIEDSGVGITPDLLPRIFDAFEQGADGPRGATTGLGLGLTIAKTIVDLHGGSIGARSGGVGCGAAFTVTLPLRMAASRGDESGTPRPGADADASGSLRVLLVEDHADTATTLARLLDLSGHRVRTVGSVAAALDAASREAFDIVLSDIGLPDRSGYDLMLELKEKYGLKGIALTGYGMEEDVRRAHDAGFVEHVVKPINFDRLRAVIEHHSRQL
jgi:signal transduction histidine kinase